MLGFLQVLDGAYAHHVVGREQQLDVGVLGEHGLGHAVAFVNVPVRRLGVDQTDGLVLQHRAACTLHALARIVGTAYAFQNRGFGRRGDAGDQELAGLVGAGVVVHADEGHRRHAGGFHGIRVQPVVDVDDLDAGGRGFLQRGDQALRVARRNHDGRDFGRDQVIDQLNLLLDGGFLGRRLDLQRNAEIGFCAACTFFHLDEKGVGQGLHDQTDFLLGHGRRTGAGRGLGRRGADAGTIRLATAVQARQHGAEHQNEATIHEIVLSRTV